MPGNHFIECDIDMKGYLWLTIHTGSRNLGLKICNYHTDIMLNKTIDKRTFENELKLSIIEIKKEFSGKAIQDQIKLLNEKLTKQYLNKNEYLTGTNLQNYLDDMKLAQKYASINRYMIMKSIVEYMGYDILDKIESVHNYIDLENKIIRKGAISAQDGEVVVIPISMAFGSIIAVGKGNPDFNFSSPHGSGRVMSRSKAKKEIDMELYKLSMEGIYSTCVNQSTLDESPFAYKDPEMIIDAIGDTVDIVEIIRPILNIKAGE